MVSSVGVHVGNAGSIPATRNGVKDFVEYLNTNAFELRHDMELIRKYANRFKEEIMDNYDDYK